MDPLSQLHVITNRILDAGKNDYGVLHAATNELYKYLIGLSGVDVEADSSRDNKQLESGRAIGLTWAAMCITDLIRTKRFMDGVRKAVDRSITRTRNGPVHILYAGTGPFALLALPLTAIYNREQIRFIMLEVNEESYACMQNLWKLLGIDPYISNAELADATIWKKPDDVSIDIMISETMQQALRVEPQVAIGMNLIPQLDPGTLLIPERVTLHAALVNLSARMKAKFEAGSDASPYFGLGEIFVWDKELSGPTGQITLPIPANKLDSFPHLHILTDITVFEDVKIQVDECALSMPLKLADLTGRKPSAARFSYALGNNPGIRYELLE